MITLPTSAVVLLVGPAGCGKSSFAARQFRDSEIVSSDAFREAVSDDITNQAATKDAFALVHRLVEARLKHKRLAVVDATNLRAEDRAIYRTLAAQAGVPCIALCFSDVTLEQCHQQNQGRSRRVPDHVINTQFERMVETVAVIDEEGFDVVYHITGDAQVEVGTVPTFYATGWDIIGDVHGCWAELSDMLDTLGYRMETDGEHTGLRHPEGRRLAFVGDFVDRGPESVAVLKVVRWLTLDGHVAVRGNHDHKVLRALKGNPIKIAHGLAGTLDALAKESDQLRVEVAAWLDALPYYVKLRTPLSPMEIVLSHAGLPQSMVGRDDKQVQSHCLFGEVEGFSNGLPIRGEQWRYSYAGTPQVAVFGHTVVPKVSEWDGSINVDTGCVFGGALSAVRVPEFNIVSIPAKANYAGDTR